MSIEISPKRIKVVLLEDNPRDAEVALRELRRAGFDPEWVLVETEEKFLAALEQPPDLIISDFALPQFDGLRAVDLVRGRGLDIPFILVSGTLGEEAAVNSMRKGVDDYLLKASLLRLGTSVAGALEKKALRDEQKKANESLRENEHRLRAILESSLDAIITMDHKSRIVEYNAAAERIFGFPRSEAIGQNLVELIIPPALRERHQRGMAHYLATGEGPALNARLELSALRIDGSEFPVELSISRVVQSEPPLFTGFIRDLTERKLLEAKSQEAAKMLVLRTEISAKLISDVALNPSLQSCCELITGHLDAPFTRIWVLNVEESILELRASAGLYTQLDGPHSRVPVGQFMIGRIAQNRRPHLTNDVANDPHISDPERARLDGMVGFAGFPLLLEGGVLGVLALFARHPVSEEVLADLVPIANALAQCIKHNLDREALLENESRLRLALDAAHLGTFDWDVVRNRIVWSRRHEELWGFARGEFGGNYEAFAERVHPDDIASINAEITRCKSARARFTGEFRVVWPDGSIHWVAAMGEFTFDDAGRAVRMNGAVMQITERKQAEQRILEQAALLDKANDSIIVCNLEHRVMFWNHGAESIFGWSKDEVMGNSIRELFFADPAQFDKAMQAVLQDGEWAGELEKRTKSNQAVISDSRWTLLRDDAGQPKSILTIETNITERKQMERQLLRTQRLESIGTLAGGIAHDLNNALAPIMMSVELLRMQYPAESKMLDMIGSSAKRGADMVRQLLSFAKGAEGERVALQPGRLVKELENLMKGSFPKNIQLAVKSDPNLPMVIGDATQLHQVLLNLCVNARDAMPNGGMLTLEAQRVEVDAAYASSIPNAKPGNYLTLRVRDTGTGIPPEILDRIFDPFFSTKGPDKGTGLGLSTVMGIVKGHGGFLHVQSQPGQGSTFSAYLPADRAGTDTEFVPKTAVEFRGQEETILLVDDEANVREIARRVLRRLNFDPLTATDGADGIIQAAEHRTKLRAVITDLNMPHMDGLAFVRALRRMLPDIPVVVASGQMEDGLAGEFKALGVTSRLDKPFTEAQLAEVLKNLLAPK